MRLFTVNNFFTKKILLLGSVLFLSACGSNTATHVYRLQALDSNHSPVKRYLAPHIAIEPIQVAQYLNRKQLISFDNGHELKLDDFNIWAEPLEDGAARVIAENLQSLSNNPHIYAYPWPRAVDNDYKLQIKLLQFEAVNKQYTILKARWIFIDSRNNKVLSNELFTDRQILRQNNKNAVAAALSQNLYALSLAINNKMNF